MSRDSSMTELNGFLAKHEPIAEPRLYDIGAVLGEWRVTAFLGSGGNAEVYRVVRVDGTSGTFGTSRTAGTDGRARTPVAPQPQYNENEVGKSIAANPECSPYRAGALKVLLRDDDATRSRFAQEISLRKTHRLRCRASSTRAWQGGQSLTAAMMADPFLLPSSSNP